MSDWPEVILRDLCWNVQYGYTTSASKANVGPKFLRITDIVPDLIDWEAVPHCEVTEKERQKYLLKEGDIVVARTGATTGWAKRIKSPPATIFASYLVRLQLRKDVDAGFVGAAVESSSYKEFIQRHMGGAAQPNANAQILTSFPLKLPPLPTQRKIAAVLSAYDDLIENNARRVRVLEEMARALYREWFVEYRYPGHEDAEFVEDENGRRPAGWDWRYLQDVAVTNFRSIKKGNAPEEILYVDLASVGTGVIESAEAMSFESAPGRARRLVRHGDVMWATVRPNRRSFALVINPDPRLVVSTGFAVLTPLHVPYTFFYMTVTTDDFSSYLVGRARGAAYPAVAAEDFQSAPILIPDQATLRLFHERAEALALGQENLRLRNANLRRTRDLLLPKLVSGELDVSTLDIQGIEEQLQEGTA